MAPLPGQSLGKVKAVRTTLTADVYELPAHPVAVIQDNVLPELAVFGQRTADNARAKPVVLQVNTDGCSGLASRDYPIKTHYVGK